MTSPNSISISITSEVSPKYQLPTKRTIAAEAKAADAKATHCHEWFEINDASPSVFQKILAELLGTFILIFVGCAAALTDQLQKLTIVGIAIVWGVVLMADIYVVGYISGAHFNPAVSIALAVANKFPWKHVPMYVLAQVLGATVATLILKALFGNPYDIEATMTKYKDSTSHLEAIIWEFLITFILMFCICAIATDYRATKDIAGVAIGGILVVNVMIAGPITGASMNPARSLGPAIVSGVYKNLWVYIVAPILGAVTASLVFMMLRVPEPAKPEEKTKNIYNHLYTPADP